MRVFLLFSALFLAFISFVVAAPAADTTGNNVSDQSVSGIIATAITELQPLTQQFSTAVRVSDPDTNKVNSIVSQINTIISNTNDELRAAVKGDALPPPNLSSLLNLLVELLTAVVSSIPVMGGALHAAFISLANLLSILVTILKVLAVVDPGNAKIFNFILSLLQTLVSLLGITP